MSLTAQTVLKTTVTGINGAGSITLTGAQVGDTVITLRTSTNAIEYNSELEATISVADQIQQTSGQNLTSATFTVLLIRPATSVCCISA